MQFDDGAVDDYSDLPPISGSAQRHGGQPAFYPSGLRDDGYTPSMPAQVCAYEMNLHDWVPRPGPALNHNRLRNHSCPCARLLASGYV